jgi:prephenate dehydrogenase
MRLQSVTIVGVGLIGGSIGMALRARGLAQRVVGLGRDADRLAVAQRMSAIDVAETDEARAFADASVVVACTPVNQIAAALKRAAQLSPADALLTDAGSTKAAIASELALEPPTRHRFIGAHPIAGAEFSGVEHARADLFQGSVCVLTPTEYTDVRHLRRAEEFWASIGCRILCLTPDDHDQALARSSHLPHIVASAIARDLPPRWHALAGGGFRDTTRVAASQTELWTAIFLENQKPILEALVTLQESLEGLRAALERADAEAIANWWEQGRAARLMYNQAYRAMTQLTSRRSDS